MDWKPLSVSGTQTFSIVSGDMKFAVIPILDIFLKFRFQSKLPGQKENIVVLLQADARVSYPVEIGLVKNGNKICSASYKMFSNLELLSISSPVIGYQKRINAKSDNYQLHGAQLNLCTLNSRTYTGRTDSEGADTEGADSEGADTEGADTASLPSMCYDTMILAQCQIWGKSSVRADGCETYATGWPDRNTTAAKREPCSQHHCHALCEDFYLLGTRDGDLLCKSGCDMYMSLFQKEVRGQYNRNLHFVRIQF